MRLTPVATLAVLAGCLQSPPGADTPDAGPSDADTPDTCPPDADKCMTAPSGHLYAAWSQHLAWPEASLRCAELGGYLATIGDAGESELVSSLLTGVIWLGASDDAMEDEWKWVTGEPFDYEEFPDGEPNGGPEENCLVTNWNQDIWNDLDCETDWGYACEIGDP